MRRLAGSLSKTLFSQEISLVVTSVGDLKLNSTCRQQFKCPFLENILSYLID